MLSVHNLATPVLKPASLSVAEGECVAVQGPSGAGKSVLLRAIADLDPNTGAVSLGDRRREAMPAPAWRRLVAYVAAESGWWLERVGDHFADPRAALPLVEALGLPAGALEWPMMRLSTGERQRLAFARTLVQRPAVLLLDEPTAALDEASVNRVEALLRAELARGVAILLVTHAAAQAERLAGRRLCMEGGCLSSR
ncbi:ATP-binding cassette domain-containing protein [Azospirillum sp. TSO22-1]|uniref:ABC transporter ATP-binding protein n=1 Tax=Azospirillum sp. TSO22-1 TaxID=716789 RepID=UPI000D655CB4|nr:ATP-binding cassette domain-containing protein [Azospirillum sp. TSO22-1]